MDKEVDREVDREVCAIKWGKLEVGGNHHLEEVANYQGRMEDRLKLRSRTDRWREHIPCKKNYKRCRDVRIDMDFTEVT